MDDDDYTNCECDCDGPCAFAFDLTGVDSSVLPKPPAELSKRVGWRFTQNYVNPTHQLVKFGEYEGLRRLGFGSYGEVFLARDPKLEREVAIKICKLADEEHRNMFLREAQLIARLSHHPNIVTIYELGRFETDLEGDPFDGAPFMVMELAQGWRNEQPPVRTLKDMLRKQLSWEDALDFYRQAGRGLAAAHAAGVVHGDFKPSNVLLGEHGAMVSDFGLAHTLGSAEGYAGGTDGYRAPELYGSGSNSPEADQFAFCVALWELIVGRLPVDGNGRPHICPPGVMPPRLIMALLRGFSLDLAERWPSMDELLDELDQIRAVSKVAKPRRPRLPGGFLLYTIVGGVVGAAIVALAMERRPEPRAELPRLEPSTERALELEQPADDAQQRDDPERGEDAELSDDAELSSDAELSEDGTELSDDSEPSDDAEPSEDVELTNLEDTACTIAEDVFVEPSKALEEVCKMIRAGQFQAAAEAWRRVLEERTPKRTPAQLRYAVSETEVVITTCEHYLATIGEDSPLSVRALDFLEQVNDYYQRDSDELDSSQ